MHSSRKWLPLSLGVILITQLAIAPVLTYPKFAGVQVKPGGEYIGGNGGVMKLMKSQLPSVQDEIAKSVIPLCDIYNFTQKSAMRRAQDNGWPRFVDDEVAFEYGNQIRGTSRIDTFVADDDPILKKIEPHIHSFLKFYSGLYIHDNFKAKTTTCEFKGDESYIQMESHISSYFGARLTKSSVDTFDGYTTTTWTLNPERNVSKSVEYPITIKLVGARDAVATSLNYSYTVTEPLPN